MFTFPAAVAMPSRPRLHQLLFLAATVWLAAALPPAAFARTRSELEATRAAKAEAAAWTRLQGQIRAKADAQAHLRQQFLMRSRLNALARVNALAAQKRAADAAAGAARAQQELADAASAARSRSPALVNYRKWAGNKMVWHHFQGALPPEDLRRLDRERARDDAERAKQPASGCASAGGDGTGAKASADARPAHCETPQS